MLLTRKDLSKRWKVTSRFLEGLPASKLPRLDIGGGKKRCTYRYRLTDVEAYEAKFLQDSA